MQTTETPRTSAWILLITVALLSLGAGAWFAQNRAPDTATLPLPQDLAATVLPNPRPLPAFALVDHHNRPFTPDSLKGHWTFLFFGYTRCPDICPTTLGVLDAVDRQLAATPHLREHTQTVFVSVDPERDPTEHLARFVPYFNQDFIGATGAPEQIQALTKALGVMYMRSPAKDQDPNHYWIDHTAAILLIDPEARFHALFSAPHDPAAIAAAFARIRGHRDN